MAEKSTSDISLLCWNIAKVSPESPFNDTIKDYLEKSDADLCFLQEVPVTQIKTVKDQDGIRAKKSLRLKLPTKYKLFYFREGKNAPCNCLIYNKEIFEVKEVEMEKPKGTSKRVYALDEDMDNNHHHYYDKKIKSNRCICGERTCKHIILDEWHESYEVKKRVCAAILRCINIPHRPEVIVVSCHLPNPTYPNAAEEFFEALDKLRQDLGYPVLVAGDFNCPLLKYNMDCVGFEIPHYNPTIRKVLIPEKNTYTRIIDFFAYKNFGQCVKLKLSGVHAEIVLPSSDTPHPVCWNNGQPTYTQYQEHLKKKSTLHQIHENIDHDPIKAVLNISVEDPLSFYLIGYNSTPELITKYKDSSRYLCILQNKDGRAVLETNSDVLQITEYNTNLPSITSIQFSIWIIQYHCGKFYAASLHKVDNQSEIQKDIQNLFEFLNKIQGAVIIAGDFNIRAVDPNITYPFFIQHSNSTAPPTVHSKTIHINFLAYKNSDDETAANISLLNIHSESMITEDNVTENEASPYNPLKAILTIDVTPPTVHVLYCDMKSSKSSEVIFYYLTRQNPKPDIYILQNTTINHVKSNLLTSSFTSVYHDKYFKGVVLFNYTKLQLTAENSPAFFRYTQLWFKCKMRPQVEFIVIVDNYDAKAKTDQVEQLLLHLKNNFNGYPVLLAGTYSVDLFDQRSLHDFVVPTYNPTMCTMINPYMKNSHRRYFFAYKSCADITIDLHDIHAEMMHMLNLMDRPDSVIYDLLISDSVPGDALHITLSFDKTEDNTD